MAVPMRDTGEALIPPELATDEPPITDAEFDQWVQQQLQYADDASVDPEAFEPEDMPEQMRLFMEEPFDFGRAEWAMAKLADVRRQRAEADARLNEYVARLTRWYDEEDRKLRVSDAYFAGTLENMLRLAHEADPKVKSLSLPSGKVTSSGPAKGNELEAVFDGGEVGKAAFIEWALEHRADLVHVEHKVLISEVRDAVEVRDVAGGHGVVAPTDDGEVSLVPGLVVRRKERTFKANPG